MLRAWDGPLDPIRHLIEFPNPEVEKQARLLSSGILRWAPKLAPTIKLYTSLPDVWLVPVGAAPQTREALPVPDIGLRPYQVDAFRALVGWDCGVVVAPCGAGKTQIGCGILAVLKRGLVVVHTADLAAQWAERCEALGIPARVATGSRGWDRRGTEGVVISTVQTLTRVRCEDDVWPVVIVDEAHHAPATTYTALMTRVRWDRIYGLTATPTRADGMTPAMYAWLGPLRHTVERADLVKRGNTIIPRVVRVLTKAFTVSSAFGEMVNELCSNEARNTAICRVVKRHGQRPQLVLTSRVEHAEALAKQLEGMGMLAAAMTGATKDRDAVLEALRMGLLDVVVATQLADEGLDVPSLTAVHLVAPSRAAARVEQRIGRIMRPYEAKVQPVVYDYVDDDSLMQSQWRSRAKVYRAVGVTRFDVLEVG